ncbi:hypothetical protein [Streptomyces sp. GS7]|uniref:hypothetical protein n=1 Tax=Streptomyces sp. GS7 TaxID=2692234 RepID=UPI0013191087|nr:hypothetical protein [Streptomyces sp. GS7]QHC23163.1 hypothetical protein GR130_18835 [Streptomyces sp. GS7]
MGDDVHRDDAFWTITVLEPILVQGPDPTATAINDAVMDVATIPISSYVEGPRVEAHHCPDCGADRGWTAFGHWTDPARLVCPAGHTWTPWEDDPA